MGEKAVMLYDRRQNVEAKAEYVAKTPRPWSRPEPRGRG